MKIKPVSEHQIQTLCNNYAAMKGWFTLRLNSGAIRDARGHLIRLSPPGTPDTMLFRPYSKRKDATAQAGGVELIFIEYKSEKGKPTFLQTEKMKELTRFGAYCYIVHSFEEMQKII